jgi:feruloyl esterase
VNNDPERNGPLTHGFDPQARLDHGYNSYDQITQTAKTLIRIHYGHGAERSYFVGCSEGGREAMLMSQRFPDYFDGILACAPGFRLPKAALFGEVWDTQTLSELAVKMGVYDQHGTPFLNKTFTDEDLEFVSSAVLGACDALDDLADGVTDNSRACTADLVAKKLTEVTCEGSKRSTCLLPEHRAWRKRSYFFSERYHSLVRGFEPGKSGKRGRVRADVCGARHEPLWRRPGDGPIRRLCGFGELDREISSP